MIDERNEYQQKWTKMQQYLDHYPVSFTPSIRQGAISSHVDSYLKPFEIPYGKSGKVILSLGELNEHGYSNLP